MIHCRNCIISTPSLQNNVMSVAEACSKFTDFILNPSININKLQDLNDIINKYFDTRKSQTINREDSSSIDIQMPILQIPVILCQIEYLQRSLDTRDVETDVGYDLQNKYDLKDKLSNNLCVLLSELMRSREIRNITCQQDGRTLEGLLYEISLTLAKLSPVNDIDFATQEPIVPENRIVTSDRYQHDINSLLQWLRHKDTNPWTNLKFSCRDINYIRSVLQNRKINSEVEISEGNVHPSGDPNLEATLDLARALQQQSQNHFRRDGALNNIELVEYYLDLDGDEPHLVEQLHTAVAIHEVMIIRNRPETLGFFRRQASVPQQMFMGELIREAYLREIIPDGFSANQNSGDSETYERLDV